MRLIRLALYLLISCLFIDALHAVAQANQTSAPEPAVKALKPRQGEKAPKPKPSDVQKQIQELTSEIAILEQSLALTVVQVNPILKTPRITQWVDTSCRLQMLLLQQTSKRTADPQMLAEINSECMENKRQEAANKFRAIPPPAQKAAARVENNEPAPKADAEKTPVAPTPPGTFLKLSANAEAKRLQAVEPPIDQNAFQNPREPDEPECAKEDKLCVTLNWAQKSPTLMPLRKSGDYRFHAVNLNRVLYDYTMTGEAPTPGASDDLSLFSKLIQEVQSNLLPAGTAAPKAAPGAANEELPCPLSGDLRDANSQVDAINKALLDVQPQATDKKYGSIPLSETKPRVEAIQVAFTSLGKTVRKVQIRIADGEHIPLSCKEEWYVAASTLITDQYSKIRDQVNKLDKRYQRSSTQDQEFHCEQTAGCSMSIQEFYSSAPTTATPNPWKATLQATLTQLTLSGGFLLTELQARSYSSRTAPDPTAPTTKTVNVLGVDYSSGVRPALTALFNYHLPFPNTDWPKSGFALSAGPVIDISNGKADTSRFGFFGGISAHIWNRFWITPGIHVGEFADTPQGFKGPGDTIPPNSGTPTPVKRYTGRFAIAITFQGGNPAAVIGEKKTDTPSPSKGSSNSGSKQ